MSAGSWSNREICLHYPRVLKTHLFSFLKTIIFLPPSGLEGLERGTSIPCVAEFMPSPRFISRSEIPRWTEIRSSMSFQSIQRGNELAVIGGEDKSAQETWLRQFSTFLPEAHAYGGIVGGFIGDKPPDLMPT